MTRKHIAAVEGGGGRQSTKHTRYKASSRLRGAAGSLSVYFTDYTWRFKQVSRDGESDPALKSHQCSARVTQTRALLEFREFTESRLQRGSL